MKRLFSFVLTRHPYYEVQRSPGLLVGKPRVQCGLLFNPSAWWVGVHYSPANQRFCINLLPCFTVWLTKPEGIAP